MICCSIGNTPFFGSFYFYFPLFLFYKMFYQSNYIIALPANFVKMNLVTTAQISLKKTAGSSVSPTFLHLPNPRLRLMNAAVANTRLPLYQDKDVPGAGRNRLQGHPFIND